MAEQKPKPYSRKRQGGKVLKGDAQKGEGLSVPVEKKDPPPKKEGKKTPKGKEYQVSGKSGNYYIEFTTGGQIPKELSGMYTRYKIAEQAIDAYEAKRGK
jgi:hypothetical protein